jgi:MFS family permease
MLIALPAVLLSHGWEAWQVGLAMVPSALVALVVPQVTGPLLNRVGPARALAVAGLVASVALLVATVGAWAISAPVLVVGIILVTFAFGLGQPALSAVVGDAVPVEVRGVALGVSTLLFLIGGSIGSAVVAGISGPLGMPAALLVLAVLPVLGLVVLAPTLRSSDLSADSRG